MEYSIRGPNFTSSIILNLTNTYNWIKFDKTESRYIKLKNSTIEVFLHLDNSRSRPPLEILFRDDKDNLIGAFTYNLVRDPFHNQCNISQAECLFLEKFGSLNSYMSTSAAVEKLMEYPDIKEWLLWNQL